MSTKKTTRARPADQDAAAPASTGAPDADVSPPHTDAAAALLAAGEPARTAAEAPAPTCAYCDRPADPATTVYLGRVAVGACDEHRVDRRAGLEMLADEGRPAGLIALQAQESDAEALAALCAAQHQHPRDDVQRAIGVLAGRIAARVLA